MNGLDLWNELTAKTALLDTALNELGKRGKNYADAEKSYKIALAKKILLERERGTPVTIISDVCRGNPEIAQLRFARDVAEVTYKAALEAINVYKIEVNILREQADREWNRGN